MLTKIIDLFHGRIADHVDELKLFHLGVGLQLGRLRVAADPQIGDGF